jgi:hypothetical protein
MRSWPLIGSVLVKEKLVTNEQLEAALVRQTQLKAAGKIVPVGQVLIDMKVVSEAQIRRCLQIQQEVSVLKSETEKLGVKLLEANLITPSQLQAGLADHRAGGKRLGECLVARGFIAEATLERFIRTQAIQRLPGAQPAPRRPQP